MALDKQTVRVALGAGVETKMDPKQVQGKMLLCENGVFTSPGRVQHRNGFGALSSSIVGLSTQVTTGRALGVLRDELFMADGYQSYSRAAIGWVKKGVCEALEISVDPVVRNTYQQTSPDMAVHPNGITVAAWEDSSGGCRYSVFDTVSGQAIVANTALGTNAKMPKVVTLGAYVVIFFYEQTGSLLKYISIPALTPTSPSSPVQLVADGQALYDITTVNGNLVIAFWNTGGGTTQLSLMYMLPTLATSAEVKVPNTTVSGSLTVFGDQNYNVWAAWYDGSNVKHVIYDSLLANVVKAATTTETVASVVRLAGIATSTATLFYEVTAAATYNHFVRTATVTLDGATVSNKVVVRRSVGLASKPWLVNGTARVLVAHQSTYQGTFFVVDAAGDITGKLAPGVGGGLTTAAILPEANVVSPGVVQLAYLQVDRILSLNDGVVTQKGVMTATLDYTAGQRTLELSANLHATGGILYSFDGFTTTEHGFHLYPENLTQTPSGVGGSIAAGTYQWCAVYEYMDGQGLIHRSAPSLVLTATTTGSTSSNAIVIPTLRLTAKTPVSVVLYRTAANQQVFYRITSITSPLLNDPTADTVTFTDTLADASIIGNEQLYTTGGEVENIAAPAPRLITNFKGRAILVPSENPTTWWFSKQALQGVPVEWNDSFQDTVDQRIGSIQAVAQMDDKLVFWGPEKVFYTVGSGPSADGLNNDFQPAQLVTGVTTGCENQRSIVEVPAGLMFQAPNGKGIWLLGRDLTAQYAGAPVEQYTLDASVTSAFQVPGKTQVRFTLDSGIVLMYDYLVNDWSVHTGLNAVDSVVLQDKINLLQSNGLVLQETPGQFADVNAHVRLRVRTAWLSFAGLQGFQRVWRMLLLGDYISPHRLIVSVAYDFNPEPAQQVVIDVGAQFPELPYGTGPFPGDGTAYYALTGNGLYGSNVSNTNGVQPDSDEPFGGDFPLEQFRLHLQQQKCQSIQITIEDAQVPPYGEGMSLSGLAFEVGAKRGLRKMSAKTSAG